MRKITQWTLFGVVLYLFPLAGDALAQWRGRGYEWGHGPGMMGGYGGGWFGSIIMVAFWIAVIIGIVFLIRWLVLSTKGEVGKGETALDILKKRYARGEIDKKEFDQKKKDLV
jgi:putative membrane protein